jgi:hypothetical protein
MADQGKREYERKHSRTNLDLPGAVSIASTGEKKDKPVSIIIKTLGGGGILMISPTPLQEGTLVNITAFFKYLPITFMAEVVWTKSHVEGKQKQFRLGLKFRSILDNDLLYIQQLIDKQLQIPPPSAG